jgi:hypothetical protein
MGVVSTAQASWSGTLAEGAGSTTLVSSGLGTFATNWKARSEGADSTTTNACSCRRTRRHLWRWDRCKPVWVER